NIKELNEDVPDDLVHVLERMLRKRPEDRYQAPIEILRDLLNPDQIDLGPRLVPLDRPEPQVPWLPRKREPVVVEPKETSLEALDKVTPVPQETRERAAAGRLTPRPDTDSEVIEKPRRPRQRSSDAALPASPPRPAKRRTHWWTYLAVVGAFILVLALMVAIGALTRNQPRQQQPQSPGYQPPERPPENPPEDPPGKIHKDPGVEAPPRKTPKTGKPPPPISPQTGKVPPRGEFSAPSLYPADVSFDPIQLHEAFAGPLATLPPADPNDVHFTVGRL